VAYSRCGKAIDYGVQIARGLAKAHEKGITHRDLKPENLFITKDWVREDSGLRTGEAHATALRLQATARICWATKPKPGVVMGTGRVHGARASAWANRRPPCGYFAFGTILYEVLAGKRAFFTSRLQWKRWAPSSTKTLPAFLCGSPPPLWHCRGLWHRCLEKNPEQRFQSASDLAFALEDLSDSGGSSGIVPAQTPEAFPELAYSAIAAAAVLAVALAIVQLRPRSSLAPTNDWTQITSFADSVTSPAFSPDGRMLTFLRGDDAFYYCRAGLCHASASRQSGRAHQRPFPENEPGCLNPDGANIAYTVPWDTWTVPVLGGKPPALAAQCLRPDLAGRR